MQIKTAEELLEVLGQMPNEEKQKFLNEIFYLYFNKNNLPRMETEWED